MLLLSRKQGPDLFLRSNAGEPIQKLFGNLLRFAYAHLEQCDQIGRFIGLLGNFLKHLATINLPKSLTFLGNFCEGFKIYHFSNEIIFGQFLQTFGDFFLVTLKATQAFKPLILQETHLPQTPQHSGPPQVYKYILPHQVQHLHLLVQRFIESETNRKRVDSTKYLQVKLQVQIYYYKLNHLLPV